MRYLGLDLGTKTLGLSLSDITGTIASTYKVIRFSENDFDSLLPILNEIVKEENVEEWVLGLPKNMNNTMGDRALTTLEFKEKLESYLLRCQRKCLEVICRYLKFGVKMLKSILSIWILILRMKEF